jgi:hypothetical protein
MQPCAHDPDRRIAQIDPTTIKLPDHIRRGPDLVDETLERACVAARGPAAEPEAAPTQHVAAVFGVARLVLPDDTELRSLARLDNRLLEGASHAHHHQLRNVSLDRLDRSWRQQGRPSIF